MAYDVNKVIKVAENEVGYLEKKSNANLSDKTKNAGSNNFTKYWNDMAPGMNGQSWCNCFVNWVFVKAYNEADAKKLLCSTKGWSYYTPTSAGYFKNNNQWYSKPKIGDIIYFRNSERICHVGLVYKVDSSKVYTIEGNTSGGSTVVSNGGGVAKKSYPLNYSAIAGYGRPNYDSKASNNTSANKPTSSTSSKVVCFKQYKGISNSIVDALKDIGCNDTSIEYRKKIAKVNKIITTDSSKMNENLLSLLKKGRLIKP